MLDQRGVTLFDALWAFYEEHEYCGELDGGVEGDRVWMACRCGAIIDGPVEGIRAASSPQVSCKRAVLGGSSPVETILLVDDEAETLAATREMLTGRGYQVLDVPNTEEAIRVASTYVGAIHLLLTDAVMAEMSGEDLAQQLRLQRPEMKVLCMAEFTVLRGQHEFSTAASGTGAGAPIILKPFTVERLTDKVQEVLTARPPSPDDPPPDPWRHA